MRETLSKLSFGPLIFHSSPGLKKQIVLSTYTVRKQMIPAAFRLWGESGYWGRQQAVPLQALVGMN